MTGNPEFIRNIWLQCSWQRLMAAVIVIGILYYASGYLGDRSDFTVVASGKWLFNFIIGFWGTRRAADTLAEEVGGNTWETQRMSGLSAWQMVWGKLLGGTAYPWFCALLCLAFIDISMLHQGLPQSGILYLNTNLIVSGLVAHAVSLSVALLLLRKAQLRRRLMVTFAQLCGLIAYVNSLFSDFSSLINGFDRVQWYGQLYPVVPFHLISLVVFGCWAWFGLYRLMRLELQYSNWPWAWCAFLVFTAIYVAGFAVHDGQPLTVVLAGPLVVSFLLTYLSFLAEPKDPVRYRWGLIALQSGEIGKALGFLPLWLISYVVTVVIGVALIVSLSAEPMVDIGSAWFKYLRPAIFTNPQILIIASLLFVIRDILFLLLLNFGAWRQRADLAGVVYLLIAYFPLASILTFTGGLQLLPIVMPYDTGNPAMSFGPVLVEIIVLAILVLRRWRLLVSIRPVSA